MRTVNKERENDPEFDEAVAEAEAHHADLIEQEAFRRAVIGVDEPVYHQGFQVDTKKVYSDSLLSQLLKGHKPKVFGQQQNQIAPPPVTITINSFERDQSGNVVVVPHTPTLVENKPTPTLAQPDVIEAEYTVDDFA